MAEKAVPQVTFHDKGHQVVLDNGIVQVTISKPIGIVTGIRYGGIDNLLEIHNKDTNRGYWDMNWSEPDGKCDNFDVPFGSKFELVHFDGNKVEVSFTRPYGAEREKPMVPLTIDKRFVLLRGSSGFYTYGIYQRDGGWRDFNLNQTRIVFKLRKDRFNYMAIADDKMRLMPSPDDLSSSRADVLAYKEAILIKDPISDPSLKGEVDDKYCYTLENIENKVQGWVCLNPHVGFWMITPSNEFRNGGPNKQDLTSHVGPTCLSMFHSAHFAGLDLCMKIRDKEAWQKVFGPVFIYLNSRHCPGNNLNDVRSLWDDAKKRMIAETKAWPYNWPSSPSYPKAEERGAVSGRLLVADKYAKGKLVSGSNAWLGLALPGEPGSWERDSKGYQFWTRADKKGYFKIENVRTGKYDLYGWVPGVIGDYKKTGEPITICAGECIELGGLTYTPPRHGPTIWEIGYPDRTSECFHYPDPDPNFVNRLLVNHHDKWRQYGLWTKYTELYPENDVVYTIGESDWTKDWYYAQSCRRHPDGSFTPVTWQVRFQLSSVSQEGVYKLRLAFASSTSAAVVVRVNDPCSKPVYETPAFGKDNAIARHGSHGLYALFTGEIPGKHFRVGENVIFLTQRRAVGSFTGVMYDYLRLEADPRPSHTGIEEKVETSSLKDEL